MRGEAERAAGRGGGVEVGEGMGEVTAAAATVVVVRVEEAMVVESMEEVMGVAVRAVAVMVVVVKAAETEGFQRPHPHSTVHNAIRWHRRS